MSPVQDINSRLRGQAKSDDPAAGAESATAARRARGKDRGRDRSGGGGRLPWLIGALLSLQTGAIALKAWDEKQASDRNAVNSLLIEARALAERIDGRVETIQTAMTVGQTAGLSRQRIVDTLPGVDALMTVPNAMSNGAESRSRVAGEVAEALVTGGLAVGMTADQDIIIVSPVRNRAPLFAITKAEDWLPMPAGERRFTLVGNTRFGTGALSLREAANGAQPDRPMIEVRGVRSATACAPLSGSALSVCSTAAVPLLGLDEYIRLVLYALLLAAPALAILGLARQVSPTPAPKSPAKPTSRTAPAADQDDLVPIMREARAGSWRWDIQNNVIELDAVAAQLLGFGRSGLSIRRDELFSRIARPYHTVVSDAFDRAHSSGQLQTIFAVSSNTKGMFAEMRGGQTSADHATGNQILGGLVFDVSKAKQSDLKLRRAEERLRRAIDGFSGPFALWDAKHRLVFWNRSFELDFGLQDKLRAGTAQETVWLSRAETVRRERIVNDDNSTTLLELYDRRWLKIVEREIPNQGFITLGLDVTENVKNEDLLKHQKEKLKEVVTELQQSEGKNAELARKYQEEKLKAEHAANTKSAFLANMSHELRTPLNAINGFSEMLVNELFGPLGDGRYKSYAGDILTAGRHLLDLINDILDMSKIEAGKMTVDLKPIDPIDPVDAAIRIVRPRADEKGIVLSLDADETVPEIDADHRAMRQMVLNLVSNAIKFTPDDGRVHVGVRVKDLDEGTFICIAVTDTGIGIDKDDLERLGKPFEQAKQSADNPQKGTGLGLALTKSLAELHGGQMTMESELGEGTCVSIYLPVTAEASGAADTAPPAS